MKTKRLLSISMALVIVLSVFGLAGCNDNGPKKDFSDDDVDISAYAGIEKYAGDTIKFLTWVDHKTTGEGTVPVASFIERFDINVEIVPVNQFEYTTKLAGLIASGSSPDIIVDNDEFPRLFASATDLSTVSTIDLKDEFWDKDVLKMSTVGGKTYFLNSENSPWNYRWITFYNKKLFEDNGFKTPDEYYDENNWTIDTFVECARKIKSLGGGIEGASVRSQFAASIWETGTIYYDYDEGKLVNGTKDKKLTTALQWSLSNKEKGYFVLGEPTAKAKKNELGMWLYGDYGLRTNSGLSGMDANNIGFVPLPKVNKDDEYYPSAGSWRAYGICKGSKNPEAAGYFIRWFLDFDNYDRETMFMSKEASAFYDELREIEDHCFMIPNNRYLGYSDVQQGTAAQVDMMLKSISNNIQATVDSENEMLK